MKILLFVQFCSSDFVQVSDSSQSLNWIFCGKNGILCSYLQLKLRHRTPEVRQWN